MRGLVSGVLVRAIEEQRGADAVDGAPIETDETGDREQLTPIEAGDLCDLLEVADEQLPGPPEQTRRRIGRRTMESLAREHPSFFVDAGDTESFLVSFEEEVYPHLSRLFPEMEFPEIVVRGPTEGQIEVVYRSELGPCRFVEGLIDGLADRYGQTVDIERPRCTHDGDGHCAFRVEVKEAPASREP